MASIDGLALSHYSPQQVAAWRGRRTPHSYLQSIACKVVLVAEELGSVAGFGQLNIDSACVEAIYVHPQSTRRHIGSLLLAGVEAEARANGLTELSLDASLNSVAFYAQAGYSSVREAAHELELGVFIPCVVMRKHLLAAAFREAPSSD